MTTKLYLINVYRPVPPDGQFINHIMMRHTEESKDKYVKEMQNKFGPKAVTEIKEYNLVGVTKIE